MNKVTQVHTNCTTCHYCKRYSTPTGINNVYSSFILCINMFDAGKGIKLASMIDIPDWCPIKDKT